MTNKDAHRLQQSEKFRQLWRETLSTSAFSSIHSTLEAMLKTYAKTQQP